VLEDVLRAAHPQYKLATSWSGDTEALGALERGEAHVAAVTAPVSPDGVERELRVPRGARVVHVAVRSQGLIVPRGNPLGLETLSDLRGRRVHYVARRWQGGAPTTGDPDIGSAREALVHTAVAEAVRSGLADAGIGVAAAAAALGLDFVPLEIEDYDLVLREDFAASDGGKALLAALRSDGFRARLAVLGGYDDRSSGVEKALTPASAT